MIDLMVLVPHEDDDLAVAGSMIYGAVQKKQKIKIVFATNGDYYKKEGAIRIREAKCALGVLGVEEKDILFLGYGDSVQGSVHLYNAPEDEVIPAYCGNDTTYGTEDTPEFCMVESGCHHVYTRRNFKQDLKAVVEKYMPQILITTDWDNHMDHLALSLMLDEVLGELLQEKGNYKPLVLKGLAYNGKWEGRADYYEPENTTENYNEAIGTKDVHPLNQWKDRIRFQVPEQCDTPLLKDNILYRAACAYPSQSVDLKAPQFINRDAVFWRRRTESLTYRADIRTSSGEAAFLKDFKCADCSDILHDFHCYDKSIWIPDMSDEEKKIVITLEHPEQISEIHLYESSYVGGQIKNIRIWLEDGTAVFDSGELNHDGSCTIVCIPLAPGRTTSVITLQVDAYEGTQIGLTEIEVYGECMKPEQYDLPLDLWDEKRDLPRREAVPVAKAKREQRRHRFIKFGRVRLWPWKYFLMKQYPQLEETTSPFIFFLMHLRFWFVRIFRKCSPILQNLILPILLLIVAFYDFNRGIDLTDAGYNIDYFLHFKEYSGSEVIPTFWSFFLGYVFTMLPFGRTWIGISFYCTIVIAAMMILAYFFCKCYMDYRMVFVAEILAVMYCWNPGVVLYDYLSFLLLEVGVILLMRGIQKDSWGFMLAAGIVLGVNVFVRVPNLTHCAAIVLLWMNAVWNHKKFRWAVRNTLICVAGYLGGLLFSVAAILTRYDLPVLKLAIYGLTETSASQANYGILYMATETLRAVFTEWTSISWATSATSVAAMKGVTSLVLLVGILLSVIGLFVEKDSRYRLLCLVFLGVFYVTPLGSNNHIYLSMLNMFLLLPIMGMLIMRGISRIGKRVKYAVYPLAAAAGIFVLLCGGEILLFGATFNWKDSPKVKVEKEGSFIDGMWTSENRREDLLALEEYFFEKNHKGSYGILYCDAPALAAVLDLQPVMSSPWPDWYIYSVDALDEGIIQAGLLAQEGNAPCIILNKAYYEVTVGIRPAETTDEVCIDDKYYFLVKYMKDYGYEPVFMTNDYVVYWTKERE